MNKQTTKKTNSSAKTGEEKDLGLIPGSGRSPGGGRTAWTEESCGCKELDTTERPTHKQNGARMLVLIDSLFGS